MNDSNDRDDRHGPGTPPGTDSGADRETGSTAAPRLGQRLLYLFVLLRRGDARLRHGRQKPGTGVFQGQGRVLRLLSLHSPVQQRELAYLLGIRPQSLGELLGKLERGGMIVRSSDPDDRRAMVVEITDKGRAAVDDEPDADRDDPFSALSDEEQEQFAAYLDRVIEAAEHQFPGGIDHRLQAMRHMWLEGDVDAGPWGFGGPHGHGRSRPPFGRQRWERHAPYGRDFRDEQGGGWR